MTTTRKYYESLIDSFSELNAVQPNQSGKFLEIKANLNNLIQRIIKFDLFTLTFSNVFFNLLNKDTIDEFSKEKLVLTNELYYELHECLGTSRLRFGGELMQYISKIEVALLNLSVAELNDFEKVKKASEYFISQEINSYKSEADKTIKRRELNQLSNKYKVKKERIRLTQKKFLKIEIALQNDISKYKSYIYENYPSLCDNFSFYNKKVIAYITQAASKEIFEFRIHSYTTTSGDVSTKLEYKFYDFYPAYFDNLEEIIDHQYGALVIRLFKKDLTYPNPFSIKDIHRELISIFLGNAKETDIEEFIRFILKCEGHKIIPSNKIYEMQFDIATKKDKEDYLFEIFHHQPRSIDKIIEKINRLKDIKSQYKIQFVFTTNPGQEVTILLRENKIIPIYLNDLINKYFSLDNSIILHWFIKSKLAGIIIYKNSGELQFSGVNLIAKLDNCPEGEKDWANYEKIGIGIFKFLFEDNFKKYLSEEQIENDLKNHRRDLLVNNNYQDSSSFWADVKSKYQANAIIVDFKNYSRKLDSTTFFNVSKYTKKNVGNFAIIFSRKGIDDTAKTEQKSLFENGKLVIVFSDEELKEMIREKIVGKDPIDRLESKKFELIKKS